VSSGNRKPNQKLIALRVNKGMSPEQLSRLTGVSAPTIRLAERGHIPMPRTQFAIAEAFDLEPLDIWPIERQAAFA
jgi:transcriptional regulator with XRE-family HTH domain